jgi:hypothetical protein
VNRDKSPAFIRLLKTGEILENICPRTYLFAIHAST